MFSTNEDVELVGYSWETDPIYVTNKVVTLTIATLIINPNDQAYASMP